MEHDLSGFEIFSSDNAFVSSSYDRMILSVRANTYDDIKPLFSVIFLQGITASKQRFKKKKQVFRNTHTYTAMINQVSVPF